MLLTIETGEATDELDLTLVGNGFRLHFPLPPHISQATAERLTEHPPVIRVLELCAGSRRAAAMSLYTTAAMVAASALELAGRQDEELDVPKMLRSGALRPARMTLEDPGTADPSSSSA